MKKIGIAILILAVLILVLVIVFKNFTKEEETKNNNFKIVTTFYPIYIMTANITENAENIELVNMTDVNVGCLHDYTLSTKDMKKIEKANVIIQNGLGLENFMDKILNTYSHITVIDSSENIPNKIEENGEVNSHIWTSFSNYISQVEEVANRLAELNSENATTYMNNKEKYTKQIEELQEKYNTSLTKIKGQKVICLNESITYLANEIGLEVTSIETDHEESALSAEMMKSLINKMKQENITAILVESNDDLKSAETLANETNAKIYKLKSGLTGKMDVNEYINAMNDNLEVLIQIY